MVRRCTHAPAWLACARYIHVHHLYPLSEAGEEHEVDPATDLRPVCPNCHAVLHLNGRCRTIEEVRQLLEACRTSARSDAASPLPVES